LGWVAFEPSGLPLWARVQQSINPFLTQLWRKGAFMGNKAEEAFFVKVDAENNPPASVSQDKLNITVGFAPIRPAEFIVMNISLNTK
jgi:phage tail sheath protein FI